MKKIYVTTLLSAIVSINASVAQTANRCGTQAPSAAWDTWFNSKVESFKQQAATQRKGNNNNTTYSLNTYTIPVIFHIIHGGQTVGTYPNLAQAQINSQVTVLNQDYSGTGFNANTYPATAFKAYAALTTNSVSPASVDGYGRVAVANTGISFALATTDPLGATLAEPGIERIDYTTKGWANPNSYTNASTFQNFIDGTVKPATIWDVTKYFNIWITDENSSVGLLGYSTFPSGSTLTGLSAPYGTTTTDGCWFYARVCGSKNIYPAGTYDPTYCYGRTICHETGHYLGLRHTWGDNGSCGGTDYCNDTPPEKGMNGGSGYYYGCPTYPSQPGTCTYGGQTNTNGDMFMNIMDYTDDACMYMFTNDQAIRMQTALANSPNRPSTSGGAVTPICNAAFSYTVSPYGHVTFLNAPSELYFWNFGDADSTFASNPVHTYTAVGTYTVQLVTSTDSTYTNVCSSSQVITITQIDTCSTPSVSFTAVADTAPHTWDLYATYSAGVTSATWYWGDGTSTTGLTPQHIYNTPANYNICVTAFNICGDSVNYCVSDSLYRLSNSTSSSMIYANVINTSQTTGIAKNNFNANVAIYPNPNKGAFYIKTTQLENAVVEVYNAIGQKVLVQNLQDNITLLNMANFNNGMYQVRVLKANTLIYQTKLVKQD